MNRQRKKQAGVTLVEMAIVLIVIGLIILIIFPALNVVRLTTQRNLTTSNLQTLMRATAAYVQATGCLPCPTPAGTSGVGFGIVRGDTAAAPASCGNCPVGLAEGIPPFASLGLPASVAHDGYGHWITMRVDPALTVNFGIAPPTGSTGLCLSGLSQTNRLKINTSSSTAQQAAVVFVSHGANGYGAFIASAISSPLNGLRLPFPNNATPNCTSVNELCNASGTTQFVDLSSSVYPSGTFDDVLVYLSRNALVSAFGNGSCSTVW